MDTLSSLRLAARSQVRHARRRGFTLLEMLVALAVFAVIGVLSSQLLTQMVTTHGRTTERGERLTALQRAMHIMQRDIEQLAHRYVRDELGDPGYELEVGGTTLVELTRVGWQNPLGSGRTELQRVAYVLEEGALYRVFWPVLDRAPDSEPVAQLLLPNVESAEFFAIDISGNEHAFWPLLGDLAQNPDNQLTALQFRINAPPYGDLERIWQVSSATIPERDDPDEPEPRQPEILFSTTAIAGDIKRARSNLQKGSV